jgi:Fe-S-cluster containining protein
MNNEQSPIKSRLCRNCNGACCQGILIGHLKDIQDAALFVLRGLRVIDTKIYTAPCSMLTPDGLCTDYLMRPRTCQDFKPGCELCLKMRRLWFPEAPETLAAAEE